MDQNEWDNGQHFRDNAGAEQLKDRVRPNDESNRRNRLDYFEINFSSFLLFALHHRHILKTESKMFTQAQDLIQQTKEIL